MECRWTAKVTISKAGAAMLFRSTPVRCGYGATLPGHFLHRIATLMLTSIAAMLSEYPATTGFCAEKRSVPNFVIILIDDKCD